MGHYLVQVHEPVVYPSQAVSSGDTPIVPHSIQLREITLHLVPNTRVLTAVTISAITLF
jgi:hypothetical protein